MMHERERLPLDARLLSESIIELNISRRNVAIYPRGHPLVEKSLNRAFELLKGLLDLRPEMTLAVAKDTLVVDNSYLDKKNPVYRDFALHLNRIGIASVTFSSGLTKDELYSFHSFLSEHARDASPETVRKEWEEKRLTHVHIEFIDYGAFTFEDEVREEREPGKEQQPLWERYAIALMEGRLQTEEVSDAIQEVPPETLAGFMNRTATEKVREESYERIITAYIRRSSESSFSSRDLKKLMVVISRLRPEVKRQFLSAAGRTLSSDMKAAEEALREIPVERIIGLLNTINEQKVAIPENLENLLKKLSTLRQDAVGDIILGGSLIADDVFLSPDVMSLLSSGNFERYVSDAYQEEIQRLINTDVSKIVGETAEELRREFSDEYTELAYNQTILELLSTDIINEKDYERFVEIVKGQAEQMLETGQYGGVLKILKTLESNAERGRFREITSSALQHYSSPGFLSRFVESLRIIGRLMREEAMSLCDHYGKEIIPYLMDALIVEESQANRRFLISLLTRFGDGIIPETIKRLGDPRWYVKRNMLFILSECGGEEVLPHVRSYCFHDNRRVCAEAIKCLLKAGDAYGVAALREHLRSGKEELIEQAAALAGAYRVRELVPELLELLGKKSVSSKDYNDKVPIVRALGSIGDPRAVAALREIVSTRGLIFKGAVERLKEEVYRSLRNYPYEDVRDLVEAGLRSRNERIREEAMRVKRMKGG